MWGPVLAEFVGFLAVEERDAGNGGWRARRVRGRRRFQARGCGYAGLGGGRWELGWGELREGGFSFWKEVRGAVGFAG